MADKPEFAHLHVHTEYSLLDGACRVNKLAQRVAELGMDSIAVTDHGVMTGLYKLQVAANKAGIKPIFGIELYFIEDRAVKDASKRYYHLTALAETTQGLHNLYKMNLRAAQEGMYYGKPRVDYELLKEYGEGVIILSGCLAGRTMQSLANADLEPDPKKRLHAARDELIRLTDCVGQDNVYAEMQNSGVADWDGNQWEWNSQLKTLADDLGIMTVGTADTHYLTADETKGPRVGDPWFHDTMLCVQTRSLKDDPLDKRMSLIHDWNNPHYYHLRNVQEMRKSLENVPESIPNSLIVAERCNAEIRTGRTFEMLPDFPVPEDYKSPSGKPGEMDDKMWGQQSYLREKIWQGLHTRYGSPLPAEVVERAEYELEVINKMGTTSYFLITWDWIRYAREIGMVIGPGRGCFVPDTLVWTSEGYKRIADIESGDQILNENGQLASVRKSFDYDVDEEMVHLKHYYGDSDGLTVTPDHKILVEKGQQHQQPSSSAGLWETSQGNLEWIAAKDIQEGDLVAVPVPQINNPIVPKWDLADYLPANQSDLIEITDHEIISRIPLNATSGRYQLSPYQRPGKTLPAITETRIPRFIKADAKFCHLLGLLASDGWMREYRNCLGIAERRSQIYLGPSLRQLWASVWGSAQLSEHSHPDKDFRQYETSHPVITAFYGSLFCDYEHQESTKHLPEWVTELPADNRQALISGLWMGDKATADHDKYSTSSPRLAHQVRTLLWGMGVPASLSRDQRTDHRPGFENRSISYNLVVSRGFSTNSPKQFGGRTDDYMLLRVYDTSTRDYQGKVYDLAVEDPSPPSYTTSSCLVHNSGAGSIVLYALDVTQLCPLEHKLLFERFLSPDRISMPDVDTDAAPVGEADYDKVRQYLRDKYGEDNCAQIITFQTIGGKAGIRSAARAFGPELLPLADRMSKAVPMDGQVPVPLKRALEEGVELQQIIKGSSEAQKIIESALWMEGLISAESVHAAAFVISPIPLTDALPVQLNKDGNAVTSFAMSEAESVGCLKLDLLGLRNLSILADAQRLIKKYHDIEVDAINYKIPMDDKKTYEMLARGESMGVFQFECLAGDTIINGTNRTTIEELYRNPPQHLMSLDFEDGKRKRNKVLQIVQSGQKQLYRVNTRSGYTLRASADHKILTTDGWVRIEDLAKDHQVAVDTKDVSRIGVCSECGKQRHSRAGHCNDCHELGKEKGLVSFDQQHSSDLHLPQQFGFDAVESIKLDAIEMTYDIAMQAPLNNYLANGIVVHNSSGMADTLRAVGTTEFNDLVAIVAAYRPGAMEQIPLYARRKKGLEEVTYGDERMRAILEETYGLILYQEESMLLSRDLAGFTGGLMDTLRKAISKKSLEMMAELKPIFFNGTVVEKDGQKIVVPGCLKNGVDKKTTEWIWSVFEASASYSFNKCLSAETEILMTDGSRQRLSEVYQQQPKEIMSLWPDGTLKPHQVKGIVRTGNKPLFEVVTKSGKRIKITKEHRLLTTEGYLPLSEMSTGTELITAPDGISQESLRQTAANRNTGATVSEDHALREIYLQRTDQVSRTNYQNSQGLVKNAYQMGFGSKNCSIASNGKWCVSNHQRAMCEWLTEAEVEFEMHTVLPSGRSSDFYFDGIHWEMDEMDRTFSHFAEKYDQTPFMVVTPEDYQGIVSKKIGLEYLENGDPIVSIEPAGNGSTFDIEMERGGPLNFIANNIVSHNSHAAAYALISYTTAYLKANYPVEYMSALLTSVMHTKDKVPFYLYETKRMGIEILAPSVNESFSQFEPSGKNGIRFGLTAVKGVGEGIVEGIVAEREQNGLFKSLWDFCQRVDGVNRRELDNLIKAGALDSTGESRMGMLEVSEQALKQSKKVRQKKAIGQDSLFDAVGGSAEDELAAMQIDTSPAIPKEEFGKMELFRLEREVTGLFVSGHPLDHARAAWERVRHLGVGEIGEEHLSDDSSNPRSITVAGIVTGKRAVYTKRKNQRMLIIQLEDLTGHAEIVVFPKLVEQGMEEYLNEGDLAYLRVTIEEDTRGFGSDDDDTSRQVKLIAQHVGPFNPEVIEVSEYYDLKLPADVINPEIMEAVKATLLRYPGQQPVRLMILDADGQEMERHVFPEELRVSPSEALRDALKDAVGA